MESSSTRSRRGALSTTRHRAVALGGSIGRADVPRVTLAAAIAVALGVGLGSCSLFLPLDADCASHDACGAYRCNEANTQCLIDCIADAECADGHLCDIASAECRPLGCQPQGGAVLLEYQPDGAAAPMRGDWFELDAAAGDGLLVVAFGSRAGLGFSRFRTNGALVPDTPNEELGLVQLDRSTGSSFRPAVNFTSSIQDTPRFSFAWEHPREDRFEELRFASLVLGDPPAIVRAPVAYVGGRGEIIDNPTLTPAANGYLLSWQTLVDGRGQIRTLRVDANGRERISEVETVSNTIAASLDPSAVTLAERWAVVRRDSTGDAGGAFVTFVDASAKQIAELNISRQGGRNVSDAVATAVDDRIGAFWVEDIDGGGALITSNIRGDGTVQVPAARFGRGFEAPRELRVAARESEVGVAWIARRAGVRGVWVQRFSADGQAIGAPALVTPPNGGDVVDYAVVGLDAGYGAISLVDEGEENAVYYQRLSCN